MLSRLSKKHNYAVTCLNAISEEPDKNSCLRNITSARMTKKYGIEIANSAHFYVASGLLRLVLLALQGRI